MSINFKTLCDQSEFSVNEKKLVDLPSAQQVMIKTSAYNTHHMGQPLSRVYSCASLIPCPLWSCVSVTAALPGQPEKGILLYTSVIMKMFFLIMVITS